MKMIFTFLSVLVFYTHTFAQATSPGFDSTFAAQLTQKLALLGSAGKYKGLSAAAIVPGQGTWVSAWGQAGPGTPLTPDMRLGIASNSKAFVAALLLKLQEEGLLDLDDPVSQYLSPHPHVNGDITLRQLLTHTSGLFDYINDWSGQTASAYNSNPDSVWTPEDLLATVGPTTLAPGVRYSYSNTNYLLAGMVAAAAADTSIGYLLHSRIFGPLGLDAAYPPYDDVFAAPYSNIWNGNGYLLAPPKEATFLSFPATAGGIWSTAYDMVRWYDALFGEDWLSPQSQRELRDNDGHSAYALGIRLQNGFDRSFYYHGGAWGFRSYMLHEPASGISVCVLSNRYGKSVGAEAEAIFQEILNQKPKKDYDLAIPGIEHPGGTVCPGNISPVLVSVENRGLLPLDSLWVKFGEDGAWQDSFLHVLATPLDPGGEATLAFDVSVSPVGEHKRRFYVSMLPVQADGYPRDNVAFSDYQFLEGDGIPLPYYEGFEMTETLPEDWVSLRPDNLLDWRRTDFAASEGGSSLARDNYADGNTGDVYTVELPALKLDGPDAVLTFNFAHTFYPGYPADKLRGYVSTDCGESFDLLFELYGSGFETAPQTSNAFVPLALHWQSRSYSLADYAGQNVLIRFVSESGFSNLLYLDEVAVNTAVPVGEATAPMQVQVAPNPAAGHFDVIVNGLTAGERPAIALTDALGRPVFSGRITGNGYLRVQRGRLPAGIYFLKIDTGNGHPQTVRVVFL